MKVIINEYGAYVKRKHNRFEVILKEKKEEYPADQISQIMILDGTAISTNAMKLAMSKDIDIVILDRHGEPFARVYPCRLGGTTLTRRNQLEAYFSPKGAVLAKKFVEAKIKNQAYFLRSLGKTRYEPFLAEEAKSMLELYNRVEELSGSIDEIRNKLLGIEGEAGKRYFLALSRTVPSGFEFEGRTKRPPEDRFNSMLNYGYGILYSEVEKACIISGLDPYFGFLHTDRYGKPSMVLDLIEEFRQPIVDRAIITLLARKMMKKSDFEEELEKVYLSKTGREKVVEAIMERLGTQITYNEKKLPMDDIILSQARKIVRYLNGEVASYEPFIYGW
jgi:CRISPR-associated protein Cas1